MKEETILNKSMLEMEAITLLDKGSGKRRGDDTKTLRSNSMDKIWASYRLERTLMSIPVYLRSQLWMSELMLICH